MTEPYRKVVIIDDEPHVIEGLCGMIKWEEYGYHVVATFQEAMNALAFIENEMIDLVFTDVRMPGCSGLEFARYMKSKKIEADIIMISGYREFDYVKEAMEIGVMDYLVKPIFEEDVYPILEKNRQKYIKKRKEQVVHELSLHEVLLGYLETDDEMSPVMHEQLNRLNQKMENQEFVLKVVLVHSVASLYLTTGEQVTLIGKIQSSIQLPMNVNLELWSTDFSSIKEMKQLYEKMKLRLNLLTRYSNVLGNRQEVRKTWEVKQPDRDVEEVLTKRLRWLLEEANEEEVEEGVKEFILEVEKNAYSLKRIGSLLYKVMIRIEVRRNRSRKQGNSLTLELERLDRDLRPAKSLEDYVRILFKEVQERLTTQHLVHSEHENLVNQIENYIELHLTEKVTVKELAEVLHLHPNYLGQLIRQLFGRSFVEYLHEKRITEVMKYIVESDLSIEQIAQNMGYTNYPRFLKYFKSVTGKLPTEFRRN